MSYALFFLLGTSGNLLHAPAYEHEGPATEDHLDTEQDAETKL